MPLQARWADFDPNFHLRHSVYYDWAAQCRVHFLDQMGLTAAVMQRSGFGPILLREECVFRKEIRMGEKVTINLELLKAKKDFSRWTITHAINKTGGVFCARVTVDGAWIDTVARKFYLPKAEVVAVFQQMPMGESFSWLD